jgi:hypothetical protein
MCFVKTTKSEFIPVVIPNPNGSSYTHHVLFRENNKNEFISVAIPKL